MQVEPLGEGDHAFRLHRIGHRDLVEPDAEIGGAHFVDAEEIQRLAHILIALARRDDADLRLAPAGEDDPVELVGAGEGEDGGTLEFMQPRFLGQRAVMQADIEAAGRHHEIRRDDGIDAIRPAVDDGGLLDIVLHAFQPDPDAREARQGDAVKPVIHDLLDI